MIIDALRNKHSLPSLLDKLQLSRSSYYYQESRLSQKDRYEKVRVAIKSLFVENKGRYGYRRIHALLKSNKAKCKVADGYNGVCNSFRESIFVSHCGLLRWYAGNMEYWGVP